MLNPDKMRNLDSGIGIEPTWNWNRNRRHSFILESESNRSQWNRNWNQRCRNLPIRTSNHDGRKSHVLIWSY